MATEITRPIMTPAQALASVDLQLVEGAVAWLNRSVQASGVQLAVQVSEYVLATFFGGDFAAFSDHDGQKSVSFKALCRREDLELGESTLYRLVRIGHQVGQLPGDVADSLSLTHHRTLLAVTDQRHRQHLARLAVAEKWSVAQLTAAVAAQRPAQGKRPGRPAEPVALKWLGEVGRVVEKGPDVAQFGAWYAGLDDDAKAAVHTALDGVATSIAALKVALS